MKKPFIEFLGGINEEGNESYYLRLIMPNNDKYLDEQLIREHIKMGATVLKQMVRKNNGKLNDNFTIIFNTKDDAQKCSEILNEFIKQRF